MKRYSTEPTARLILALAFGLLGGVYAAQKAPAIDLKPGIYLLVDDELVDSVSNVVRRPVALARDGLAEKPIITAASHHPFQPYFTIIHELSRSLFRLWYGVPTEDQNHNRSRIAYLESSDGIRWTNTPRILEVGPVQFGTSVIDEGPQFADRSQRYKLAWHLNDELKIAVSPDGLQWKPLTSDVLLRHNHDINGIFYDSQRRRYVAIVSFYITGDQWTGRRRITKQSFSTNLFTWTEPQPILTPDRHDEGETQFYAMDGFLRRGDLLLGMVKVLRDDLQADNPPVPPDAYGIGYTTLAWTRDGEKWTRERDPFLQRNLRPGAWDHAHAWIDEQLLVGDELYLYYAGYQSGHKVNRFEERQIGLLRTKRDRYLGRQAPAEGWLRTRPLRLAGHRLFVNVDATGGELQLRALHLDGTPKATAAAITGNAVKSPVHWPSSLSNETVILEFRLRHATLFGWELE